MFYLSTVCVKISVMEILYIPVKVGHLFRNIQRMSDETQNREK